MLSHGGCIARGEDAAHVFALVHGVDAAAEIQVYAEMTGFPLMEIDKEKVCHGSIQTLTPLAAHTGPLHTPPIHLASALTLPSLFHLTLLHR